ncbi:MAG: succinate dehydrogenase cytochrome b subunit [Bacteroidales bacterium]|nr:succinate dehydrogenase cytochrome b subunit [Candidatus Scybalousia scybalohippi]
MKLIKLASISKKLCMGALGAFLLVFLPFHMGMNLCILRDDGGEWYRNVCHFMGTNYIVKVFEVILLACVVFHIVMGIILAIENKMSRPVGYAVANKSKTHSGSKYMIWTGGIILVFLIIHFVDFYFAKMGLVEGKYVVKVEKVERAFQEKAMKMQQGQLKEADLKELQAQYMAIQSMSREKVSKNEKYFINLNKEEVQVVCGKDFEDYEPDFYNMAKEKFHSPLYVLIYLLTFIILAVHLFHGVSSVFQTYGLNVQMYQKAINGLAWFYAVVIPMGFAIVPLIVYFTK